MQPKVEVTKVPSNTVSITSAAGSVTVQNTNNKVITVTAQGPQGPPFAGASFFNVAAISQLGANDAGKIVAWDGTEFQPTNVLETDLTISGGAF